MAKVDNQKVKRLQVSYQAVLQMCRALRQGGLPSDAEPLAVYFDHQRGLFDMIVYSNEFPKVEETEVIPIIE